MGDGGSVETKAITPRGRRGTLVITSDNQGRIICDEMLLPEYPIVGLSVSYYNSKPQVKWPLARLRRLVKAIDARDWHEPVPQFSQLARDCRNGQPRAIRNRLTPEEYERLLEAVRAGVPKRQLATQFGISLRSVYRLLADRR